MLPSLIRTFVPILVGLLTSMAVFRDSDVGALSEVVTALVTAVYYLAARLLEHYASGSFGWLLGYPKAPVYPDATT